MNREETIKAIIPLLREIDTYDDIGDSYYRSYVEKILNICAEYYGPLNGQNERLKGELISIMKQAESHPLQQELAQRIRRFLTP